jgi:hypothetical protein
VHVTGWPGELVGPLEMLPACAQVTLFAQRTIPVRQGGPELIRHDSGEIGSRSSHHSVDHVRHAPNVRT